MEKEMNKNNYLSNILKVSGLLTLFTGMFGLGFQKGVIFSTQLGNLSGSYGVHEIFNSAIIGATHVFYVVYDKVDFSNEGLKFVQVLIASFIIILLAVIFLRWTENKNYISKFNMWKVPAWLYVFGISALGSCIIGIVFVLGTYFVIVVFLLLVLFCGIGYFVGESWVVDSIKKNPCVSVSAEILNQKRVHQCTQLYFEGKPLLTGEVILENLDGYIIRSNSSFLFYSKDGSRCFYSKFVVPAKGLDISDKNVSIFSSVDSKITEFCSGISLERES